MPILVNSESSDTKLRTFYEGRRVAVVGVTGFLGINCARALREAGAEVIGFARRPNPYAAAICHEIVSADLASDEAALEALAGVSVVFDCLGFPELTPSDLEPVGSFDAAFRPHVNLFSKCATLPSSPIIVHVSSRLVYGTPISLPVDESHPVKPGSLYAVHKLFVENYIAVLAKTRGLRAVVFRLSSPYGPDRASAGRGLGVWNQLVRKAVGGETLSIYGEGEQLRDFIYIDDVVLAFLLAAAEESCVGETFNLGGERAIPLREGVMVIAKEAGGVPVQYVPWPVAASKVETGDYCSDLTKIRQFLDLPPQTPFEEGVRRTVEAARQEKGEVEDSFRLLRLAERARPAPNPSRGAFQGQKIIVVGASGFVGAHLVQRFLSQGAIVSGVARSIGQAESFRAHQQFAFHSCDLLSAEGTEEVIARVEPDIVVFVAAHPDGAETRNAIRSRFEVNVLGLLNILEACRLHAGTAKFVFGDSRKVYGDAPVPHRSTTALSPIGSYAFTKEAGWHMCRLYARLHGMTVVSVRPSLIYGPGQGPNVIRSVWDAARRGEKIIRLLGGDQTRDPIYIDDAIDAFVAAAQKAAVLANRAIAIGGQEEISISSLARLIVDVSGSDATIVSDPGAARAIEMKRSVCDLSEAARLLGWSPRVGLAEGLGLTFGAQVAEHRIA